MASNQPTVRPTRRCLGDLGAGLPDLGTPLHEIDDPVVLSAQAVPAQREAGGAERVLSLTDRVWLKVKTAQRRAVVTELRGGQVPEWTSPAEGAWWIGAAGRRQGDSPQHDFYAVLRRECTSGRTVSTDHLLPVEWDWRRLGAEQAVAWRGEMKRLVVGLVAASLRSGHLAVAEFRRHRVKAWVRATDGHEAHLAIIAEGVPDPEVIALLLDCVLGVAADDWQAEPSPLAEMRPGPGEVIWSTLLSDDVARAILACDDE